MYTGSYNSEVAKKGVGELLGFKLPHSMSIFKGLQSDIPKRVKTLSDF